MIEHSRGFSFVAYDQATDADTFHVPFEYLAKDHVRAYVGTRRVLFEWIDDATVEIAPQAELVAPPYPVTLRRFTPIDDLYVKHRDGAKLPARDLKQGFQQLLFAHQERVEFGEGGVGGLPGGPPGTDGNGFDDIKTIIDEIMRSLAMKNLLEEIELIGLNAETIIQNILRDYEIHDITRHHGDKISKAETEITLLVTMHKVIAEQITELFATLDTVNGTMQAQFLQVNQAIADEISARVSSMTDLHAQVVDKTAALNQRISEAEATIESARATTEERLQAQITGNAIAANVRIDAVEANAASSLATIKQALIAQFTAADGALNTALNEKITEVETTAEQARIDQKNLILAQVNDSIGVVQQQVNTKVTAQQAQSIASTQVEVFKGTHFASLQQQFNVKAGELDTLYGAWSASLTFKINAGTIGGKPVIAGIGLSATAGQGSDIIFMADRVAVVQPNYNGSTTQLKYPFVVGTVGGVSTVGITGQLLVDGSITANKIATNTLSAITANAGTINGGTFKTHTLNSQGQVINPLEFRAEMSNLGNWPLWIGTGAKSSNNAVMWIDRQGNAMFKGKINAQNIVGEFQSRVMVFWTGLAQTYQTGSKGVWNGVAYAVHVTSFTLPAPKMVGDTHTPYLDVFVTMNLPTAEVDLVLDVWEGGAWHFVARRQPPYVHLAWSGNDHTRPVMEESIHFSAYCPPVSGGRTYRIRATSSYAYWRSSNNAASAYVTKVSGCIVGLR